MAKENFFLKEPKAEDETLVYLFFSFDNQRLKYSTGEKIHPDFWNPDTQRARETKKFDEYPEFNAYLDKVSSTIKNIYRNLKNDDIPITVDLLRTELEKRLKNKQDKPKPTLFQFIQSFIDENKGLKAANTIKTYKNLKTHLEEYCTFKKRSLDFNDIDLSFYNDFISYLSSEHKHSQNTIGSKIKVLKAILNEATDRGLNTNIEFKKRKFKKLTEETDKIYLNREELEKIYRKDLSKNKKLERVRDLFIIGCFTGLRFSDFSQLQPENIIDQNKIKVRTQKTSENVVIPLHPYVSEILKKYNGEIPKALSNQKMNEYLKDVAEKAEINEQVITTITKGGVLVKTTTEKFNLVSTHTARRSFASNLYLADVPAITIMKITGHKTEKSFLRYIRISQEENANKLLQHPFFT